MTTAQQSLGGGATNAEIAYEQIRERLMLLDIRPGDPINDEQLAASLGFGRTPVREALKRLERDRLVVTFPRRGTFATAVDITDLGHISAIRTRLEPLAAGLAAVHASPQTREAFTEMAAQIESGEFGDDRREILMRDVRLHREVYRACGNPYLEDVLICQDAHATRIWCLFLDRLSQLVPHVQEHVRLLRAIVDGDAEAAEEYALDHVKGFEAAIRGVLHQDS
ncbi:GntR family transcriptional regulator [Gordonia sp. (in: high G+C Gram-positive bacteria)]|uniref:GntR family transcriptional regulator n=1 Tax=Gordonia sp. (in: high G+C Gram-positive bacteria) TaxID=84139 RepID=UPI00261098BB|nr:GntR family transcriptional regulator [Gordonia sp. (in: high G+C Gram-positive bacteria)]